MRRDIAISILFVLAASTRVDAAFDPVTLRSALDKTTLQ